MKEALKFLTPLTHAELESIAFDIAMHGRLGYKTNKDDYRINSFPNRTFTGYEILSWYYVSWALYKPEVISELGLPFDQEYNIAQSDMI